MLKKSFDMAHAMTAVVDIPSVEITLDELVRAYAISKNDETDLILRKWMPVFGSRSAWSISLEEVVNAHQAMLTHGYAAGTANRNVSALGSVYKWAISRRMSPKGFKSPTVGITRAPEAIRVVDIKDEEIERLRALSLAYQDRRFGLFVSLLIDSGARKSELLDRRWSDVNTEGRMILATKTKTDRDRFLHFTPATLTLMNRVVPESKRHPDSLMFEGRIKGQPVDYRKAWGSVTKDSGLPDLHMHDVRHYSAARSLRAGNSAALTAQLHGHSVQVLMQRYGHLDVTALKQAAQAAWGMAA
jgi:integrase